MSYKLLKASGSLEHTHRGRDIYFYAQGITLHNHTLHNHELATVEPTLLPCVLGFSTHRKVLATGTWRSGVVSNFAFAFAFGLTAVRCHEAGRRGTGRTDSPAAPGCRRRKLSAPQQESKIIDYLVPELSNTMRSHPMHAMAVIEFGECSLSHSNRPTSCTCWSIALRRLAFHRIRVPPAKRP